MSLQVLSQSPFGNGIALYQKDVETSALNKIICLIWIGCEYRWGNTNQYCISRCNASYQKYVMGTLSYRSMDTDNRGQHIGLKLTVYRL